MGGRDPVVLLDTNVFVAAIRDPARRTETFRLIAKVLASGTFRIVGNEVLADEYLRYAQAFPSPTAAALAAALVENMELVHPEDRFLLACAPFIPRAEAADLVHAATCLQTGAILVSDDRHFRRIRRAGLIAVLTAHEAIGRWLA